MLITSRQIHPSSIKIISCSCTRCVKGRNNSLVVCWAHCPAWRSVVGSILLWGEFFPIPIPKNSYGQEYKPRSSLCTHAFHPHIHVLDMWMQATKTHPASTIYEARMWLLKWLDSKMVTYAKISRKRVSPRDLAGECRRRRRRSIRCVDNENYCVDNKNYCTNNSHEVLLSKSHVTHKTETDSNKYNFGQSSKIIWITNKSTAKPSMIQSQSYFVSITLIKH